MRNPIKKAFQFLHRVARQVERDDCFGMAAEVGFQLMFAFFQALILIVAILSIIGAKPEVFNSVVYFLGSFLPLELYNPIRNQIVEIAQADKRGILTLGLLGTTWTMSTLMLTLHKNFQRSYNIKETRSFWKVRLIAFIVGIIAIFLIALILILLLFGLQISRFIENVFGYTNIPAFLIRLFRVPVAFVATTFLAALLYRAMSNVRQHFLEVLAGALFFCTLWFLFTYGFGYYLRNFPLYNTTYGTLGVFLILMVWMYLTALSLLIGGEVNAEIHRHQSHAHPVPVETPIAEPAAPALSEPPATGGTETTA